MYALVFLKLKFKEVFFMLILLGLMVPVELIMIPLFFNLKAMGIYNTVWALILPQIALFVPFAIFLLRGFMKDIPKTFLEAARLDGSNEFQNLYYVILPLIRPAMVAVIIFTSLWSWNNFIFPTLFIQNDELRTLPVGLNYFKSKYTMDYCMIATAANISAIPVLLIYILLQRRFITGIMMGSIKE